MFAYSLLDKLLFPFATDLSKTHASSAATSAIKSFSNLPYQFNWFFAFGKYSEISVTKFVCQCHLCIYISGHGSGWRGDASNLTRKLRAFSVKYVKISKEHQWWGVANDQCYQCTTTVQWSIEGRYFPLNVAFFPLINWTALHIYMIIGLCPLELPC